MNKILIQPLLHDLENYLAFADENNLDFEIFGFCESEHLDNKEKIAELINLYEPLRHKLYSMHGAFKGLQVACGDSLIRGASRKRIIQNCEISRALGIKNLVVHCDKLPYILQKDYTDTWVDICYEFYSELLGKYDISIIMENCWDLTPYPMKQLVTKMNTHRFKACVDTGHVHCFSKTDIGEWIDALGEDLVYLHYNDNHGEIDEHNPAGQGTFDFGKLTQKIKQHNISPVVVLETFSTEDIAGSMEYLKTNSFYPYLLKLPA